MNFSMDFSVKHLFLFTLLGSSVSYAGDFYRISDSEFDQLDRVLNTGSIRNCNAGQTALIQAASVKVSDRVAQAATEAPLRTYDYVKTNFIVPEQRVSNDQDPINATYNSYDAAISQVFSKMKAESDKGINFECKSDASEAHCRSGEVQAYVLASISGRSYPVIYLCSGYFKNLNDVDGAVTTMFHELSHYAADTEDYGLDWWNAKNPDIMRGANDAYHYQMFALRGTDDVLKRNIWYWLWPSQPTP